MKRELTTSQAAAFRERIAPMLRFLYRCRKRLDTGGFDPKSKIYTVVTDAYDAIHSLHIELHYQSIAHGVGVPPNEE
jgi:hypothetical protein